MYVFSHITPAVVEYSTSKEIVVKRDDGIRDTYHVIKFSRSNQGNCMNQRPIVNKGDRVEEGDVLADGASCGGEMALGKNPLIGFMTWEGYNYEDAVLLSEKLVQKDVYTSVHIEEYEAEGKRYQAWSGGDYKRSCRIKRRCIEGP